MDCFAIVSSFRNGEINNSLQCKRIGQRSTRAIVIRRFCVVVRSFRIRTTRNFKLVACTVTIGVVYACSVTVIAFDRQSAVTVACAFGNAITAANATFVQNITRTVVIRRCSVIVTCIGIRTTRYFKRITHAVVIRIYKAIAAAVIPFNRTVSVAVT